jgi:hypothetical protein
MLQPREERLAAREARHGLEQPDVRIGFHLAHERQQRLRREHTVGVEHDHEVVARTPARDEVVQVADLPARVLGAPPVPHAHAVAEPVAQRVKCGGLAHVGIRIRGVRKHEDLEARRFLLEQRLRHGLQGREARRGVLVVDRHHERSAMDDGQFGDRTQPGAAEQHSRDSRRRRQRDPAERDGEQDDHQPLEERRAAAERHDADHLVARVHRERQRTTEGHDARGNGSSGSSVELALTGVPPEVLLGHVEKRRGRCRGRLSGGH